jgi:hypothetical protein
LVFRQPEHQPGRQASANAGRHGRHRPPGPGDTIQPRLDNRRRFKPGDDGRETVIPEGPGGGAHHHRGGGIAGRRSGDRGGSRQPGRQRRAGGQRRAAIVRKVSRLGRRRIVGVYLVPTGRRRPEPGVHGAEGAQEGARGGDALLRGDGVGEASQRRHGGECRRGLPHQGEQLVGGGRT